jgi:hypothetical protein
MSKEYKMNENSLKNLIPFNSETAREAGKKGGAATAKVRREYKDMKSILKVLLNMPVKDGKLFDISTSTAFSKINGKNLTVRQKMLVVQIERALKGDLNSLEFIRDTGGEKPQESISNTDERLDALFGGIESVFKNESDSAE